MIVLKNITKKFDDFYALNDINFSINQGESLVIKGVSGSGKSTLLSILGGIMKPTSGTIEIEGKNIASFNDFHASSYRKHRIGFVTQSFHLFEQLSVRNNLLAALVTQNYTASQIQIKIDKALELSNIAHKAMQKVSTLSGGEKQRCVIARALVNEPSIILCDEPTANLDHDNSLMFIEIMRKLKSAKKSIIIATHDPLFDSLDFIDKSIAMSEGKIE